MTKNVTPLNGEKSNSLIKAIKLLRQIKQEIEDLKCYNSTIALTEVKTDRLRNWGNKIEWIIENNS